VESHTTVIIPFNDRVVFVSSLNCAEFSSRLGNPVEGERDSAVKPNTIPL
jgi:hypothetical protein